MLAPFLIMLREGLEAALLTSIIASYLNKTGRSSYMPAVWVGIFLAIALSFLAGAALQIISAEFPQKMQELFEAVVGFVAVIVLMSMVLWMKKAARSLKDELQHSVEHALAAKSATWALICMVFFSVAREGLESVFFLLAIFQQSEGYAAPLGAFLGVAVSVVLGFLIYHGGLRLNLRLFFRCTGILIIFVAAGLLSGALRSLHEAGIWNYLQAPAWDLSRVLPLSSPMGTVMSGLLGYHDTPAVGEVAIYFIFLFAALAIYLRPLPVQKPVSA
ncbi:iron uptake transporter permease EfeU [Pseudochrobactrum asaccharolyticum]|uniref:iron uptake transporter permease EfeU n=1 Tax=Pseudochrobactrum asaccharolyticum TaxID=354351 RepID=UPI0040439480